MFAHDRYALYVLVYISINYMMNLNKEKKK